MAQSDANASPAPVTTTHADDRELGYGAVDARPDIESGDVDGDLGDSEAGPGEIASPEVAAALRSGGESSGAAYPNAVPDTDGGGASGGQTVQGYSGPANPNAPSTREASHDRAA